MISRLTDLGAARGCVGTLSVRGCRERDDDRTKRKPQHPIPTLRLPRHRVVPPDEQVCRSEECGKVRGPQRQRRRSGDSRAASLCDVVRHPRRREKCEERAWIGRRLKRPARNGIDDSDDDSVGRHSEEYPWRRHSLDRRAYRLTVRAPIEARPTKSGHHPPAMGRQPTASDGQITLSAPPPDPPSPHDAPATSLRRLPPRSEAR